MGAGQDVPIRKLGWAKKNELLKLMGRVHFLSSPEIAFVVSGVIFGILFLLITPPFQAPDEEQHFFRSFQISEGYLLAEKKQGLCYIHVWEVPSPLITTCIGGLLPQSLWITAQQVSSVDLRFHPERKQKLNNIISLLRLPLDSQDRIFISFPGTAKYTPIPYLPQALGISLGRLLDFSPIMLLYLGRIANLMVWLLLVYLSIRIIPIAKWLLFLLALTPMSLFLAASLSADAITNGISFLLIATCLKYALQENQIMNRKDLMIIALLGIMLSLSKFVYAPMIMLFLVIPIKKFGNKYKYFAALVLAVLLILITITSWHLILKDLTFLPTLNDSGLSSILNNPINYLLVNLRTLSINGPTYIEQFIGRLGWADTRLLFLHVASYATMLVLISLISDRKDVWISCYQKAIILMTLLVNSLLIATLFSLAWTPVGQNVIEGIQGRYFIPLAPLFFLLFNNTKFTLNQKFSSVWIVGYSVFSQTLTVWVLLSRYDINTSLWH